MRMPKAVIVLTLSLALAVPAVASPSDSSDPGRDHGSVITRVLKQIRKLILGEPSVPIPQVNQ
jgi:hypothetical protein